MKFVRYIEGSLYRKPQYNEFVEKQPKCSLYRGVVNQLISIAGYYRFLKITFIRHNICT